MEVWQLDMFLQYEMIIPVVVERVKLIAIYSYSFPILKWPKLRSLQGIHWVHGHTFTPRGREVEETCRFAAESSPCFHVWCEAPTHTVTPKTSQLSTTERVQEIDVFLHISFFFFFLVTASLFQETSPSSLDQFVFCGCEISEWFWWSLRSKLQYWLYLQ